MYSKLAIVFVLTGADYFYPRGSMLNYAKFDIKVILWDISPV